MALALVMLAYAVFVHRSLLPERLARRALYRSMIGGLLTAVYVALVVVVSPRVSAALQVEDSVVGAFLLVAVLAIAGPLRDWVSSQLDRVFFQREFDFGQLLRSFGDDLLERGTLPDQLGAALATTCAALGIESGHVVLRHGAGARIAATYGPDAPDEALLEAAALPESELIVDDVWRPWPAARLLVPLRSAGQVLGLLALGPKHYGEPFRESERALLSSLASYLALAVRHDRRQQEEQLALAALAEQARQLQVEQELLLASAAETSRVETARPASVQGLRVYALGTLRVERGGESIERWGGDKAGTYQAEALFAFLFDRRGRGLTKDEAAEVIWPDLALDKADMAFHRTISALRRTLEPGLRRGAESTTIAFHHERYWLNPASIGWCDVEEFAGVLARGYAELRRGDLEQARVSLTQAADLYRGDYLDDCPFYADSAYVEARRTELRDQCVEALLALGTIYERLAETVEALACYRRALGTAGGECPRAEEALGRMQAGARTS
jgi:DNA-binding SARP family transcriptional activator